MKKNLPAALTAVLLLAAALAAATPAGGLAALGTWLRRLSLSGAGGNAAAWGIVLGLSALPALGLLWRGRQGYDWLLLLAAGEIFAGLYFLVNPTLLTAADGSRTMIGLAAAGSVTATVLAWAALRGLQNIMSAEDPGRTMALLLRWSAVTLVWLAVLLQGVNLWQEISRTGAANTALRPEELMPTYLTLTALAVMDLIPTLLCCQVLSWGGELALRLEEDPFGEGTVAMSERLGGRCAGVAAVSVGVCVAGNLLQFALLPVLRTARFNVSFPFAAVLLAAVLGLLCRYFRRAKAVSDDNGTII